MKTAQCTICVELRCMNRRPISIRCCCCYSCIVVKLIGTNCTMALDCCFCSDYVTHSECIDGKCQCISSHYSNRLGTACIRRKYCRYNISTQLRASVLSLLELLFIREGVFSCSLLSSPETDQLVDFICTAWVIDNNNDTITVICCSLSCLVS